MTSSRTRVVPCLALLMLTAGWLLAQNPPSEPRVPNFTLKDLQGKDWSLDAQKGKKATVLVFISTECPMSNAYVQPLLDLAKAYESKGVSVAFINANLSEDAPQVAAHAREYRLVVPVLRDPDLSAFKALQPDVNPQAFVLDGARVLRYRGRIDDGYSGRLKKNSRPARNDLQAALDEVLERKPVSVPVTKAYGCPIVVARTSAKPQAGVTFNKDVMPILQNHCQTCHRPGDVAPFSLMTYRQAVKWANDIKEFTQSRKMPPWKPVDSHGVFQNERRLSDAEIATIAKWIEEGLAEGDARDQPPPKRFVDGWHLGEPDLVLTVPEEMQIGPTGRDLFRCFPLPTNLKEDQWVTAVEIKPGNRRVVHHTLNFLTIGDKAAELEVEESKRAKQPDELDFGPGYTVAMGVGRGVSLVGSVGGWAPGQVPRHLSEGVAYFLPKGSTLVLQVHYHRTGKLEKDQTRIGLYFAKKPIAQRYRAIALPGRFPLLGIPPNQERFKIEGSVWVDQEAMLHTVMPHMHLLGREITATMNLPDGTSRTLIDIKDWDYNWQETYFLKEPVKVPPGTRFDVMAYYDNSKSNPLNPFDPPQRVRFGEQTTNEMCFVFLGMTTDKNARIRQRFAPSKDSAEEKGRD